MVPIKKAKEPRSESVKCQCGGTYRQVYAVSGTLYECDQCGDRIQTLAEVRKGKTPDMIWFG